MFSGPRSSTKPKKPAKSRSHTLKIPIVGDSRNVQDTAYSRPGMAMGMSISPQARLRNGISVRSVRKAKNTATTTDMTVLATAISAVLRKML